MSLQASNFFERENDMNMRRSLNVMRMWGAVAAISLLPATLMATGQAPDINKILQTGELAAGEVELTKHLVLHPKDDNARLGLSVVQLMRGVERLMQSLHKYGLLSQELMLPFLRLPAAKNQKPEKIRYEDLRRIYLEMQDDLGRTDETLSAITSKSVKVPIQFALIRMDFDSDGKAGEDEILWKIYAKLTRSRIDLDAASAIVIEFDRGDVHWLRAYCHLLMGVTDFIIAHNWKDNFDKTAQAFFQDVDSAYSFLRRQSPADDSMFDAERIADIIAFLHLLSIDVQEPERMKSALGHFETMIAQSKTSWGYIEAETDDDHEWIPNAKQSGVLSEAPLTAERIKMWKQLLDETALILKGERLIKHWRVDDGRGVNLRKVFTHPRKFDLILWIQGAAAEPFLEEGEITDANFWTRLERGFGGNFIGFAVWLN
jgi:hypothetical protein